MLCVLIKMSTHCKNIRRFYGKITGNNWQPDASPFTVIFLQAPVNIFRNQGQNGSKEQNCFLFFVCHTALQSYKGIFEYYITPTVQTLHYYPAGA